MTENKPLKLEVEKTYKDGTGDVILIKEKLSEEYLGIDSSNIGAWYKSCGTVSSYIKEARKYNLIEEVN